MTAEMRNRRRGVALRDNISAWLFMTPFLFFYLGFLLFPILRGFLLSFYKSSLGKKDVFLGLSNYATMIGDGYFWESLFNTAFFVVISTPVIMVTGFVLAPIRRREIERYDIYPGCVLRFVCIINVGSHEPVDFYFSALLGADHQFIETFGRP